ncbi:protoporphyrinogen/coproporphyrinogen oxidase [Paraglaciecola sp. 2405UD69-4]
MNIAVIGAGISGLSFAKALLHEDEFKVKVFEEKPHIGGIAKVKMVNDFPYHMIGGHCFNSKHQNVLDFVFGCVLEKEHWQKVERKASILFHGKRLGYPIEFSMKELFESEPELAINCVLDYLDAKGEESQDLEEWFINNFGKSLAEQYFIPYNKKIWGREPREMSPNWVVDKLPQPVKRDFVKGLLSEAKDTMPHATFYYPKSGTQNTFIQALAKDIDVELEAKITNIAKLENGKYMVNGQEFDHIVYTGPMDKSNEVFDIDSTEVLSAIAGLNYNKVTTMLWESEPTDYTWTYLPDPDIPFHRLIHIGNFTTEKYPVTITETTGVVSYEDMVKAGKSISMLKSPLDYNVSDHAYVVFDKGIDENKSTIINYFSETNIHFLGRFGQWDYFNMDICILEALKLKEKLMQL